MTFLRIVFSTFWLCLLSRIPQHPSVHPHPQLCIFTVQPFLSSALRDCASVFFVSMRLGSAWVLFFLQPWLSSPLTQQNLSPPPANGQTRLSRMDWCLLHIAAGLGAAVVCADGSGNSSDDAYCCVEVQYTPLLVLSLTALVNNLRKF